MAIRGIDVFLVALALWLSGCLISRRSNPKFPPGPPGWPIIGNSLCFASRAPYKTFVTMSRKYGPIMSLKVMPGKRYYVLDSAQVADDLLVKRSAITSNRPHTTMAIDLIGLGETTLFRQYGNKYRRHRWFFQQQIGTKSSLQTFYSVEEAEARQLIRNVLRSSHALIAHSRRRVVLVVISPYLLFIFEMASSVILKISHGYTVERDDDDPFVEMANETMSNFSVVTTPGRFLVDGFPILRHLPEWFPGGGFHKDARRWRKMLNETVEKPYAFVLEQLAKGNAAPSFTSRLLQEGVTPEEEELLKWASLTMYLGGADTTPSALSGFFFAMTLYPEVLKKAQAEVDTIVGHERLPNVQDWDTLPYVNALCVELLRWHVVVPWTVHVTTEDDTYNGYFIPEGTYLVGNIWSMLSNPETYPNPDVFNPERFLGRDKEPDPRKVCFGWGRRMCPGVHLAELSIFVCVATALATLDISKCVENDLELAPIYDVEEGSIRQLKPFKCKIGARSKQAVDLIHA